MGSVISSPTTSSSIVATTTPTTVIPPTSPTSCPPVALTPATVTAVSYTTVYRDYTSTVSSTQYSTTVTVTTSDTYTFYNSIPFYTQTATYTAPSAVVIEQVAFSTTVTVPTPSGFTPVLCEATYQQPHPSTFTTTSIVTYTSDSTYTSSFSRTGTGTVYKSTFYPTVTIAFYYPAPSYTTVTPTSTSTRTNPTQTVYDACNSANVVDTLPAGNGYLANAFTSGPNVQTTVYATDQVDCCAICQGNSSCLGSAYFINQVPACNLFLLDPNGSEQCDGSAVYAYIAISNSSSPYVYVSNSGCGEVGPLPYNNFVGEE